MLRELYDAAVGLLPTEGMPEMIYAVVKRTYDLQTGALAEAEPLVGNVWAEESGAQRLAPGSDYWFFRGATDVVVFGHAYLLPAAAQGEVVVRLGDREVRIAVIGPRVATYKRGGRLRFEPPEPIDKVEMTWRSAYGGGDPRVPMPPPKTFDEALRQKLDHPGLYPRNPFGKGYLVLDEPFDEGVALPLLEDPLDRLTPERFFARDPADWYRQPRPICLVRRQPRMFPRSAFVGAEPWFPAPDDERLPEVRAGELPKDYRRQIRMGAGDLPFAMDLRFVQEAIAPMRLSDPQPGIPIEVRGMHPEGRVARIRLPPPPRIEVVLEGRIQEVKARPTNIGIRPDDARVTITWGASTKQMHRAFIPGIHSNIPLAIRVDGDDPLAYTPPPTRLTAAAKAANEP